MSLPERMKFGVFMGPFHRVGENPTLAIDRDLELVSGLTTSALTRLGSESTTAPAGRLSPPRRFSLPLLPSAPVTLNWGPG